MTLSVAPSMTQVNPRPAGCRLVLAAAMALCLAGQAADTVEPISPLPPQPTAEPRKRDLGERLFNDVRLSRDDRFACASCHSLSHGGDDGAVRPMGADGQPLEFNSPTIFNAAFSFRLGWRGTFRSLEEQAEAVLLDPRLMNTTWPEIIAKLRADRSLVAAFHAAYGEPPSPASVLDALAAFQRSLVTPGARFDRYLRGDPHALSAEERHGYELFKAHGCVACHQGVNVGGNLFQKFGVFHNPFARRGESSADLGRFAVTGNPDDLHVFRVPSLRNVSVTAPYFHDGSAPTLEDAVAEMGRSQLGQVLRDEEIGLIVRFLRTLTGTHGGRMLDEAGGAAP